MRTTGSLKLIREINSSIILDKLKEKAPMSKYDISKSTGLSIPTVTKIVRDFLKIGFVKEVGMGESIGGRPPLLLDLNRDGGFIIGVDVGSDEILSIVVDFLGNIVSRSVTIMDPSFSEFVVFDKIISTISNSVAASGKDWSLFFGMGIGISGDLDSAKGIIKRSSRLNWKDVPLKSIIENSFHIPTFIDENVRLLTFAENWFGMGKDYKNIICIRVGDDIGAGIILDGELYSGSDGKAGVNISHMVVEPNGIRCSCGSKGCLDTLVSSHAIVERTQKMLEGKKDSMLSAYLTDDSRKLTVKDIAEAAKKGDELSLKVMGETGRYLAIALINIASCFDPELLIIGGGLAASGDVLFNPMMIYIDKFKKSTNMKFRIGQSLLGNDAYAIGAATTVLHKIYSTPKRFMAKK